MTTITCLMATLLAVLTIPLALLFWATESKGQRIRRWHSRGLSYRACGARYGVSHTTARRWALA